MLVCDFAERFGVAELYLQMLGKSPINPLRNAGYMNLNNYEFVELKIDLLFNSDAIYMLKNWENDLFSRVEHKIAEMLKLDIIYQEDLVKQYGK